MMYEFSLPERFRLLGYLVYETKGKMTGQRVLDVGVSGSPKLEITISGEGKIREDIEFTEVWTYWTEQRSNGVQYGEGKGVMMTRDGNNEVVTVTGQGVVTMTNSKIMRYVGGNFYSTTTNGKLAFFNNLVGVFEYEVDNAHNYHTKVWQWK
jgi:hypothetical protein